SRGERALCALCRRSRRKDTDVLKYTLYRVLQLVPVWLLLSVFVFAIVHALPGDAIDALVPPDAASNPETRAALEKDPGLDKPLYVQYVRWLGRIVLHGDFGKSITTHSSGVAQGESAWRRRLYPKHGSLTISPRRA